MPIVEDLDEDLSKQDKNLNEIEKKQKIITSHYNLDGNTLKK